MDERRLASIQKVTASQKICEASRIRSMKSFLQAFNAMESAIDEGRGALASMKERADAMPSLAAAIAGRLGAVVRESLDPQTMDDYKKFAHQADALLASSDLLNERVNICDSMSPTLCARLARYDDVQERRAIKARSIMDEMKPTLIEYIKMSSPKISSCCFCAKRP